MAAQHDSRSSGAAVVMVAAVVIGVLFLGLLALVVVGALFFYASVDVRSTPNIEQAVYPADVQIVPLERQPTLDEAPFDSPSAHSDSEPSTAAQGPGADDPAAEEPSASESTGSTPPAETVAEDEPLPVGESIKLVDLSPAEVVDVRTGDQAIARPVQVAGQTRQNAIWAQPVGDRGTCQISYMLQREYARLTGVATIVDAAAEEAAAEEAAGVPKVVFRIYGDGNLMWDSGALQDVGGTKSFDLDVGSTQLLALAIESDSPSDDSRFAWVDLQLYPQPSPASR